MKNIHVLPSDKPSELYINIQGDLSKSNSLLLRPKSRNIYITSDEDIKFNDYVIQVNFEKTNTQVIQCVTESQVKIANDKDGSFTKKKVILTTDQYLIKDGVQAIDDEFLEWFIKNPSCEEVEIERSCLDETAFRHNIITYKIIIPKEKDYFPDTKIGSILSSEDIVNEINELENQSFEGWTTDSIKGYLLACKNIKEKLI